MVTLVITRSFSEMKNGRYTSVGNGGFRGIASTGRKDTVSRVFFFFLSFTFLSYESNFKIQYHTVNQSRIFEIDLSFKFQTLSGNIDSEMFGVYVFQITRYLFFFYAELYEFVTHNWQITLELEGQL